MTDTITVGATAPTATSSPTPATVTTTLCQDPPWRRHPRSNLRDRALRQIAETGGCGLYFPALVEDLHGREALKNANYDYTHLRGFLDELERDGYVRMERVGPQERPHDRPIMVYPTHSGVKLSRNIGPIHPGDSVLDTASEHNRQNGSRASANAAGLLTRRRTLDTAAEWGDLLAAFGGKRLGHERGPVDVRTATRFNSPSRARSADERLTAAFGGAADAGYTTAVLVTATTDPGRYDSLAEAGDSLMADAKALRKKVARDADLDGTVAPGVTVVEPTERGIPHAHLPLFGVSADDLSRHELQDYWHRHRGRAQQVWVDGLVRADASSVRADTTATTADPSARTDCGRSLSWRWASTESERDHPETVDTLPRPYLRSGSVALGVSADSTAQTLLSLATAYRNLGDRQVTSETAAAVDAEMAVAGVSASTASALRRAAWYCATGLKAVTRPSPALID